MNADKFFERYSIEEISKKTKISPISLRYIKNREFDKLPRVKFFGFINIIEKTFNVDLSDLKEEYNNFIKTNNKTEEINTQIKIEPINSNNSNKLILIFALILAILGVYLLKNSYEKKTNEINASHNELSNNISAPIEKNISSITKYQIINQDKTKTTKKNISAEKNVTKLYEVKIIPNEKVWFRAINIENNKSIEYLTSHQKILEKGNYYIKFGHGNVTIIYANQTITPNTKKLVRILLKNGKYQYMKTPNRYEK